MFVKFLDRPLIYGTSVLNMNYPLNYISKVRQFIEMVSGCDMTDSDGTVNGHTNNYSTSAYQSSQPPHEQGSTSGPSSSSTTDSPLRTASHGTMQDATSEIRSSPIRTTSIAINTTSQPHSLTPDDSSNTSTGKFIY